MLTVLEWRRGGTSTEKTQFVPSRAQRLVWLLPVTLYVTLTALESLQNISVLESGCFVFGEDSVLLRFKVNKCGFC